MQSMHKSTQYKDRYKKYRGYIRTIRTLQKNYTKTPKTYKYVCKTLVKGLKSGYNIAEPKISRR
jgi:hypothetical protein